MSEIQLDDFIAISEKRGRLGLANEIRERQGGRMIHIQGYPNETMLCGKTAAELAVTDPLGSSILLISGMV